MACVWLFDVLDTVSVTYIEQIGETLKLQAIKTEQVVYKRWFLKNNFGLVFVGISALF